MSFPAIARAVIRAVTKTATRLRRELSGDLDTIIGKALRVAPEDRYGSAAHLADDLKRYLDQRPIAARPPLKYTFHRVPPTTSSSTR